MRTKIVAIALAIVFSNYAGLANAASIWQGTTGTASWNTAGNWSPSGVPNAPGANATFNGAAVAGSPGNPAQTANRTATTDGAETVGSINFNNDAANAFTNTIATGTGGPLTFDETGAGPATITTAGVGTGNNTISVAMVLTDTLEATVNNTAASSAAGSLNLTAAISGAGGFTKLGDGLATFGTGAKTYTGPTVVSGGRIRISSAASPTTGSSFTISAGGTVDLISSATYSLGTGALNLNGSGPTTGPFAAFPGAIRNDTSILAVVSNAVVLQTNTVLHVQATAGTGGAVTPTGSLTFTNGISGPGSLTLTAPTSNIDQGILGLNAHNIYSGGTLVAGGIVLVSGAAADLGTGNVTVSNATSPSSIARLRIAAGVLNAINDFATLSLAGGTAGTADLGAGVNDLISGLVLGGTPQTLPGTYGSSTSGASFPNDTYFTGTGVVTLVPEPSSALLLLMATVGLATRRRKK